jgi:asparagine synthase (glutamine-hydrolysing)
MPLRSPGYAEEEIFAILRESAGGPLDRIFRLDVGRYLAFDLLPLCDNMSMAHSLEVRVPFCDIDLVEGMARIPAVSRFPGYSLKPVLKRIARDFLPREILARKKQGFMVPIGRWFRNELKFYVEHELQAERLPDFLNPAAVHSLLKEHTSGVANHTQMVWALLLLTKWCAKITRQRGTLL